jgi:hypothetical protein
MAAPELRGPHWRDRSCRSRNVEELAAALRQTTGDEGGQQGVEVGVAGEPDIE